MEEEEVVVVVEEEEEEEVVVVVEEEEEAGMDARAVERVRRWNSGYGIGLPFDFRKCLAV